VRICGTLSPGGTAGPVDGGYMVSGKWGFVSGAWHSQWQQIIAVGPGPDDQPMPVVALVPITDLQIVDDWDTAGMRGSGSVSTLAQDLFVPAERVLPLPAILAGRAAAPEFGVEQGAPGIHGAPLLPVAAASSVGQTVGLARAAIDIFTERMGGRKITYTDYEHQTEAPVTHLTLAEATLAADEAEFHARRLAGAVDAKSATGEAWSPLERARARADLGAAVARSKTAVDALATASGGSSIYSGVPIQRVWRDIQAINLHALMHAQTNTELYGRVLCGLPPNTLYF
jgi:alkylation response protein AidB-like acyl-CoA dehydrogenase